MTRDVHTIVVAQSFLAHHLQPGQRDAGMQTQQHLDHRSLAVELFPDLSSGSGFTPQRYDVMTRTDSQMSKFQIERERERNERVPEGFLEPKRNTSHQAHNQAYRARQASLGTFRARLVKKPAMSNSCGRSTSA
mmetsp:Transcript_15423/g.39370  ORF Transcript_15423/g.39370 Transcript_15423/m.39370 type:complete len:134 (+) Transcript_15423:7323-7724(+)